MSAAQAPVLNIGVVGYGRWGVNQVRVFDALCKLETGTVGTKQYTTPQGEQVSRPSCSTAVGSEPFMRPNIDRARELLREAGYPPRAV